MLLESLRNEVWKYNHLAMLKGEPIILSREQLAETGDLYKNLYEQK
jgi:hypothetical protein